MWERHREIHHFIKRNCVHLFYIIIICLASARNSRSSSCPATCQRLEPSLEIRGLTIPRNHCFTLHPWLHWLWYSMGILLHQFYLAGKRVTQLYPMYVLMAIRSLIETIPLSNISFKGRMIGLCCLYGCLQKRKQQPMFNKRQNHISEVPRPTSFETLYHNMLKYSIICYLIMNNHEVES